MRVIIEVQSGPLPGRKYMVRPSQVMSFGRTEEADVVMAGDDEMSGIHFTITAAHNQCTLCDEGSTNGTQVNGQFVKTAGLFNGDSITAGHTEFLILIEGGEEAEENRQEKVELDSNRITIDPSVAQPSFRVETCDSGLSLLTGAMFGEPQEPAAISTITDVMAKRNSQFLIVDFRKAELPFPDDLQEFAPLFDWIPPEVAKSHSPAIILPTAACDFSDLLDQAWDKDAVEVIYSRKDPESLVNHLRTATRMNLDGLVPEAQSAQGMLGYCWPSVLAPLLAFRPPEFVESLLAGIDAVLIEMPDLPGTWQIYSRNGFSDILVEIGCRQCLDEELPPDVTPANA